MSVDTAMQDGILVVTITNPPVNALSHDERTGIIAAMEEARETSVQAVVLTGAGNSFIAGADIREFGTEPAEPFLPDVVTAIERCERPVIAAIAGQALGGGLEVALGCHYRLASPGAKLGLPEVTLGLVPGAGATQRLPRLINPSLAAAMITNGKPVDAEEALQSGLIDHIAPGDLLPEAIQFAREVADEDLSVRRLSLKQAEASATSLAALDKIAASAARRARGAVAAGAAADLVRVALKAPFEEGMKREREMFLHLRGSEQAKALRHIFFAERAAARLPDDAAGARPRPVHSVGVVGAGTMGAGIAMSLADAGFPVKLIETSTDALDRGMERIAQSYEGSVDKGRLSADEASARRALVKGSTDYEELAPCDLIIEAAFETMEVKRDIFERLDRVARPGAVLATNTSYLDIDQIARFTSRPGDVIGMHYFSPANIMRLLEVVRGHETAVDALAAALAVARRSGKVPVIAKVCHGFIGNRMLKAYVRQCGLLLLEGATPEQIDGALTRFGMAMGPFAVADLSGIDIGYMARKAQPEGSYDPVPTMVHDALAEQGHLGRKTGRGFYLYGDGEDGKSINPAVPQIIELSRRSLDIESRKIDDQEIVDRCMLALANEGGFILEEGVAARAGDIDVVYVNGYGFPRHRGGPMYHAAQMDVQVRRVRMASFAAGRFGEGWKPSSIMLSE